MAAKRGMGIVLAALLLAAGSFVSSASADVLVGDQLYFGDWNTGLDSGPFNAYAIAPATFDTFATFCALNEGTLYVNGGAGYGYEVTALGLASSNPAYAITEHTAWLYSSFLDGTLPGYVNDKAHNDALQYGIWNSMGQSDAALQAAGHFDADAKALYLSAGWNETPLSWVGFGNIKVAQLRYLNNSTPAQDILVATGADTPVPEPATMGLLLVGGIAAMLRRKR